MTTSMNRIVPNRAPGLTSTREAFDAVFGAYEPPAWMGESVCSTVDPGLFYSGSTGPALRLCKACPVRALCLEDALVYESVEIDTGQQIGEPHGVRGGLTARQRKPLVRARTAELRPERSEDRKQAAIEMYAQGASLTAVVREFGLSKTNLKAWLIEADVWRHPRPGAS